MTPGSCGLLLPQPAVTVLVALLLSLRQDAQYRASSELLIRQKDSSTIISTRSSSGTVATPLALAVRM